LGPLESSCRFDPNVLARRRLAEHRRAVPALALPRRVGVDDLDYSGAETLRSVHARLEARGIRLVEVMEDVTAKARDRIRERFGEDAFYDRLEDVPKQYQQQFTFG
jgi:hypothetical protein